MKFINSLLASIFCFLTLTAFSQEQTLNPNPEHKFSVFTTWLSFSNFGKPETNTHHYEILAGYQLTPKDRIGMKAATWKLFAPMGIPLWDEDFLNRNTFYPGRLKESGIGFTYQRMLWKKLFATVEILPLFTDYLNAENESIGKGFKLYSTYHLGYQFSFFKNDRFFIEPQIHLNYWPINTNVPVEFKAKESGWNNFFFFEPNLYIGMKF